MKLIKHSILVFVFFSFSTTAQQIKIELIPLVSSTTNNIEFKEMLYYGIKGIDKKSILPKFSFGFDIKPGIEIKLKYRNLSFSGIFYVNNSFLGPIPSVKQFDGTGKASYFFEPNGYGGFINTQKIKRYLNNNETQVNLTYLFKDNLSVSLHHSNYVLDILEHGGENTSGIDSTDFDLLEKINSVGIGVGYRVLGVGDFNLLLNCSVNYIYNYKTISFENYGGWYITNNYEGHTWSVGTKLIWNKIFVSYKYLQMQTESSYFSNSAHKFEIGINIHALSIDPAKLFGD